jgi:DNA polymerase-3 subunit gamma/tau
MPGQALYRKYRPRSFSEVIGQEHVTRTLQNALAAGRVVHAYLFSGPRGTGKTSTARILAKAVNCLAEEGEKPCNDCFICRSVDEGRLLDLIEIDAASHTGVDDIRDLREKIHFAPSDARYKFYIIDEAHMLSTSAFNALLKTLEEPPAHAYFVLATTAPHKIPATILSRCQRFDFRPIPMKKIIGRLEWIAEEEGLEVEREALELIARQATGSMRDADSLLDQVASYGDKKITLLQVQAILGTTSSQAVADLVASLAAREVSRGLGLINETIADGADPKQFGQEIIDYLRGVLLIKVAGQNPPHITPETAEEMALRAKQFSLAGLLTTIRLFSRATLDKAAFPPHLPLELAFVEATLPETGKTPITDKSRPVSRPKPRHTKAKERQERASPPPTEAKVDETPPSGETKEPQALEQVENLWEGLLTQIKKRNMHVEALLKSCQPVAVEEDIVILGFYYPFHKGRIEEPRCKGLVEEVLSQAMGQPYHIECVLLADRERRRRPPKKRDLEAVKEDPLIKAALEMGGEITEVKHTQNPDQPPPGESNPLS